MMVKSARLIAVLQALLVTFLWSTSWVLIKIGLAELPALTFAGLRYVLAFLSLLPVFMHSHGQAALRRISRAQWLRLLLLGITFYTLTQGAQFLSLAYLPAVTVNMLLSFTSVLVALAGMLLLAERPSGLQWAGVAVSIGGALLFFYPVQIPAAQAIGWAAALVGVAANAAASLLGRSLNRRGDLHPLTVTVISMGIGSILLLASGLLVQGLPPIRPLGWLIIAWLALVNTAFAFVLWNLTLRTLSATESSVINNSMLVQIPILAVIFLGEALSARQVIGLVVALAGILAVQLGKRVQKER
ncbi:MAG: EamA family transporter [Chloroflexi bacterium]|nr:EamA family transporter [Chloroflexota bacterium]